ncbi:MAG: MAPEG family protein [Lysobacter sp.]|nr:MAG: MAPEG family protein [Lysobacter sp.]
MSPSLTAVLLYAAWTLLLLSAIAALRAYHTLDGRPANAFAVGGDDVSAFSGRLCRAHANCYENLPAFAAILFAAMLAGRSDITDPLALWLVAARAAQSTVHLWSTSVPAVIFRFACLAPQITIQVWWLAQLLGATR